MTIKGTAKTLTIKDAGATKFHVLLKVYKSYNPERPLLCSTGYDITNVSKFVDYHLQPIVKTIPS